MGRQPGSHRTTVLRKTLPVEIHSEHVNEALVSEDERDEPSYRETTAIRCLLICCAQIYGRRDKLHPKKAMGLAVFQSFAGRCPQIYESTVSSVYNYRILASVGVVIRRGPP